MPLVASRGGAAALGFGFGGFFAADGDYESIATVTVGSGGSATVTFDNIPSTYQHLQIRGIAQHPNPVGSGLEHMSIAFNSATTSYANHWLIGGFPSSPYAGASTALSYIRITNALPTSQSATYAGIIVDLLDYSSTTKNKTVRAITGNETVLSFNQNCYVILTSGLWASTSAITKIVLGGVGTTFTQHSTFALYGLKAPA